jgi:hypothetical protein
MCPNHKIATTFKSQKCGEFSKKPHKMKKIHICHIFFSKMWSSKPLIFKEKMHFSTNTHFSKSFWRKFFQKNILALKCVNRAKIDYYSHIPTKVTSTLLKSKMCKMWQSAITNTFLTLKMWQEMCTRNYDWKCNVAGNKYDDRGRILG